MNCPTNILSGLAPFSPEFDLDGNQTLIRTSTGTWRVTYNGENRPVAWSNGTTVVTMAYDRMGRRVVCDMSVSGSLAESKRFAYDNYLLVQESNLATSNRPQATSQSFVWDPTEPVATKPLATSHQPQATSYYYVHDGNKNVSALVSGASTVAAAYVYAPFGAVTSSSGVLAATNPFRFSSEYHDDTLGLVYYNYRHYNPADGRWTSRDKVMAVEEYLACRNNTSSLIDLLGLTSLPEFVPPKVSMKEIPGGYLDKRDSPEAQKIKKDAIATNSPSAIPGHLKAEGNCGPFLVAYVKWDNYNPVKGKVSDYRLFKQDMAYTYEVIESFSLPIPGAKGLISSITFTKNSTMDVRGNATVYYRVTQKYRGWFCVCRANPEAWGPRHRQYETPDTGYVIKFEDDVTITAASSQPYELNLSKSVFDFKGLLLSSEAK